LKTLALVRTFRVGRSAANGAAWLERRDDLVHSGHPKNFSVLNTLVKSLKLVFAGYGAESPKIIRSARRHCYEPQSLKHHQRGADAMKSKIRMVSWLREGRKKSCMKDQKNKKSTYQHTQLTRTHRQTWHSC
jgi:hypothetical protein